MAAPASSPALSRLVRSLVCTLGATLLFCAASVAHAVKWSPPDPAELTDMTPRVDPDAGAEIILRDVHIASYVADHSAKIVTTVRLKIYNQRGVDANTLVELEYNGRNRYTDIAVRTIKPNREILELKPHEIYDREKVKVGKARVKVKSFAPPGIVAGSIIEYVFTEKRKDGIHPFLMTFQTDTPARLTRYRFNGEDFREWRLFPKTFNCPGLKTSTDKKSGDRVFELSNIPGWAEEPFEPPAMNWQPVVLCYSRYGTFTWQLLNTELCEELDKKAKTTKTITETLAKIIAPTDTAEEKLRKIYDYCRTKILNRNRDTTRLTDDEWKKVNRDASDTLKTGHGTSEDINYAFAALVRAAGFEATAALSNDRDSFFLGFYKDPASVPNDYFVYTDLIIAVTDKEKMYRLFDPGSTYLPFEELSWFNMETSILITRPKGRPNIIHYDAPPAKDSARKREATLKLDEEGTLEGDVTIEYTGLWQTSMKHELDAATDEERTNFIKGQVTAALKQADLTQIKILNADKPHLPLTVTFHVRIPNYAENAGSRFFIQPAVFQKGVPALFINSRRKSDLVFEYRRTEEDKLTIQLPSGYELEAGSSPGDLKFGQLAEYETSIGINPKKNTLLVTRKFVHRLISAPASSYPRIKEAFDAVHARDNHVLTFKRKAASEQPAPAP